MGNIFIKDDSGYKQDIYPVDNYMKQGSVYISKIFDITREEALIKVKETLKECSDNNTIKNPVVKFSGNKENGDKQEMESKLTDYIKFIIKQNKIVAPSFTVYENHSVKKSLHVDFINVNIKERSVHKKLAFMHKMKGEMDKFTIHNVIQGTKKIFNNSLSGAYASKSSILYNPSAHYTLTSITRCVAGIGNSTTESLVCGNKHFKTYQIVLNYISSVIANTDLRTIKNVMETYELTYPTVAETMEMILKSSKLYWRDKTGEDEILLLVRKLNKFERASIVYINDLYHIRKYNDSFVRKVLSEISSKHQGLVEVSKRRDVINNTEAFIDNLAKHICMDDIRGKEIKSLKDDSVEMDLLASTIFNITRTLSKYQDFLNTFFRTDNLPITIANIPDMLRETILVSDTDSTIATYDSWSEWFFGKIKFDAESIALAATVMTINSQVVAHNIKIFASNLGSDPEFYNVLEMKNEFFYSNFEVSNVAKTYFAEILIQEGNVYKEPDKEIKGVHLINSKAPTMYRDKSKALITRLQKDVVESTTIDVIDYINSIVELEEEIYGKILKGDVSILGLDKIKEEKSYKLDRYKSPYIHHLLWNDVFKSYGNMVEPPYQALKVPVLTTSDNKMKKFLEEHNDREFADNFTKFLKQYRKPYIGTFRLPLNKIVTNGIPTELIEIINKRKIILDILKPLYIVMEVLGVYKKKDEIYMDMGYTLD